MHVYTSPHLVRFNERIRLGRRGGGRLVDDATLIAAIGEVLRVNGGEPITFFEITTAVAFHLYATHPADFCLLEVGLGGRFDATNVIAKPLAAVIASVSHDHAEFLGDGPRRHRGGEGRHPEARRSRHRRAAGRARAGHDRARGQGGAARRSSATARTTWPSPSAGGSSTRTRTGCSTCRCRASSARHQIDNAGLAVADAAARAASRSRPAPSRRGFVNAEWPARMQRLRSGPLVELAPAGADIWLDGGHNPGRRRGDRRRPSRRSRSAIRDRSC